MSNYPSILKPIKVGAFELANRVWMAPLTRIRASLPGNVPNALMAEHYGQRASAGLVIAEATFMDKHLCGFYSDPGVYSEEQISGWKLTTKAVHDQGGKIFLQLVHGGRACHSSNNDGQQPVSSTDRPPAGGHRIYPPFTPLGEMVDYEVPRRLETDELPGIVALFVQAAKNAIAAGFDGVEIHAANGYLLDQFLRESANDRTDDYGGSVENRSRLTLEVTAAVAAAIGADRTGVRISPLNSFQDMATKDPVGLTTYLGQKFSEQGLAYLHLVRGDFFNQQTGDVVTPARKAFKGPLVVNGGYTLEEGNKGIAEGLFDVVAYGALMMANPDLVARAAQNAELNKPNPDLYYARDPAGPHVGYNDYPFLGQQQEENKKETA